MKSKNKSYLFIAAAVVLIAGLFTVDFEANEAGLLALPDFQEVEDKTQAKDVSVNTLADLNEALTEIVDETVPSVVTIKVSQRVEVRRRGIPRMFRRFFGKRLPESESRVRQGIGSGVIVSEDGYILTNAHVVAGAEEILVTLYDGRQYHGKVIGTDPLTDIAVVKIDAENLNPIPIGNSNKVEVGEMVLAIGSPLGTNQAHSVTFGIVSAKERTYGAYSLFIQTDAAINPGNSGGALVNMSGQLVGINTAIISQTGGYQGIGLAVPSNIARSVMRSLIDDGEVERGYLGISFGGTVDATMARALEVEVNRGVIVGKVQQGSPADEAGLQEGDIIYKVNGDPIVSWSELRTVIGTSNPGEEVELSIVRDGEQIKITVTLGKRKRDLVKPTKSKKKNLEQTLGFEVDNLTPRLAQRLGLERSQDGVVVTDISRTSEAYRQGLQKGDIITSVSNQPVENIEDFIEALNDVAGEDQVVLLEVIRDGTKFFVAFEL